MDRFTIKNVLKPFIFIAWFFNVAACFASDNLIKADHPDISYTGRIDFKQANQPYLTWPGSKVEVNFTGTALTLIFDDDEGKNYFNIIIDGQDLYPDVIATKKGLHSYLISKNLSEGSHSVEIFKRTEGSEGGTKFIGLRLAEKGKILAATKKHSRRIEFYGDSITSGMGNEAAFNTEDKLLSEKNHYLSYASLTARALQAEHHSISHSGIGIMVSWFDFTMGQYFDQLSAVGNNDSQWNFTSWTPDVVVVNLMQNDRSLVNNKNYIAITPNTEQRIQSYQSFIEKIRKKYPQALIVCALGSMNASRADSVWPGYVNQAVARIKKEAPQANIETLFFDFTGYEPHPRVAQHFQNAKKLTQLIKSKMSW